MYIMYTHEYRTILIRVYSCNVVCLVNCLYVVTVNVKDNYCVWKASIEFMK